MQIPPDLPPVIYVPAVDLPTSAEGYRVEYRLTKDGRKALLIYSAMDRLITAMGPHQPWLVCSLSDLDAIWQQDAFDVVYLDIAVPEDHQRKMAAT